MIDFGVWNLACPPRTGGTWVLKAAGEVGFLGDKAHLHLPHTLDATQSKLCVSTVRCPVEWLQSYWLLNGHTGVAAVDRFLPWRREADNFEGFLRLYLDEAPGAVGEMFFSYRANSWIRTDELNEAFEDILETLGISAVKRSAVYRLPPVNVSQLMKPSISPTLKEKVFQAEAEMLEHFEF